MTGTGLNPTRQFVSCDYLIGLTGRIRPKQLLPEQLHKTRIDRRHVLGRRARCNHRQCSADRAAKIVPVDRPAACCDRDAAPSTNARDAVGLTCDRQQCSLFHVLTIRRASSPAASASSAGSTSGPQSATMQRPARSMVDRLHLKNDADLTSCDQRSAGSDRCAAARCCGYADVALNAPASVPVAARPRGWRRCRRRWSGTAGPQSASSHSPAPVCASSIR